MTTKKYENHYRVTDEAGVDYLCPFDGPSRKHNRSSVDDSCVEKDVVERYSGLLEGPVA